jgi:hypothetical protein
MDLWNFQGAGDEYKVFGQHKIFLNGSIITDHSGKELCQSVILKRLYKIVILSLVLYGCETWSLALREERSSRV